MFQFYNLSPYAVKLQFQLFLPSDLQSQLDLLALCNRLLEYLVCKAYGSKNFMKLQN